MVTMEVTKKLLFLVLLWRLTHANTLTFPLRAEQMCQSATLQLHSTHSPATRTLLMLPMLSPALWSDHNSGGCWGSAVSSRSVSNLLQQQIRAFHLLTLSFTCKSKNTDAWKQPKDIFHSPFWYSDTKCNFSLSLSFNHRNLTLWLSEETTCKYQHDVCETINIADRCVIATHFQILLNDRHIKTVIFVLLCLVHRTKM